MNDQRMILRAGITDIVNGYSPGASGAPVTGRKIDAVRGSALCEDLSIFFNKVVNKHSFIIDPCIRLLDAHASNQELPPEDLTPGDKEKASALTQGRDSNIGVVGFGAMDFMGEHAPLASTLRSKTNR